MTKLAFAALAALILAGCGGGGNAAPPVIPATSVPTATPTLPPGASPTPSATPTHAGTASPSPNPTATPTIAAALKVIGGAPLTATASQLSVARRNGQAHTLAQGVTNGLPILVESSGMVAIVAATQGAWVSNVATSQDLAETGLTVTPSGNLLINNPGPTALSCLGQVSAMCAVHPMAWQFGTSSANGKPVGKQTIAVAFSDGTSAQTFDYIYDGWNLPCDEGWAYQNGIPVATTTQVSSDVYADCLNGNIDFPKGAIILAQPTPDQYGLTETIMPTLTTQPLFAAANGVVPMASVGSGMVFGIQTQDGGFAKVYFTSGAGVAVNAASGMSLHSQANGTFAF